MKTYSFELHGERYEVSVHPQIVNFFIVHYQTGEYLIMMLPQNRWRCLNDNPYCSYLPVNDINLLLSHLN
jgi:hypothetical protein